MPESDVIRKEIVSTTNERLADENILRSQIRLELDDQNQPKYASEDAIEAELKRRIGGESGHEQAQKTENAEVIEGEFVEVPSGGGEREGESFRRETKETPHDELERILNFSDAERRKLALEDWRKAHTRDASEADWERASREYKGIVSEKPELVNPNREKLKDEVSLRKFMREQTIEIVRLAAQEQDLTLKAVEDRIVLNLGYDPKVYVPASLFGNLPDAVDKEQVKAEIEAEIKARCNLRGAELKEDKFKSGEFGVATTDYVNDLSGGKFVDAQISNDTLIWLGETLTRTENLFGDEGLKRIDVDTGFQLYHCLGAVVERFRVGFDENEDEKKKIYRWDAVKGRPDEVEKRVFLTPDGDDRLRRALQGLPFGGELFGLVKDAIENKASLYGKANAYTLDDIHDFLEKKLGSDGQNLAWQLFEGLRCEGLYFSGHYLGGLTLYAQSRNFLTLVFDSWGGSRHDKVAVFRKGKWFDSEGRETRDLEDYVIPKDTDLTTSGVVIAPKKDAFLDELKSVSPGPISQNIAFEGKEGSLLLEWAVSGRFLETFPRAKKIFGGSTIEASCSAVIKAGYDFKDSIKKLGGIYIQPEKGPQVKETVDLLTETKKKGLALVNRFKVFSKEELARQMDILIDDALWELGVNNIFNVSGSQFVTKPRFLTPSGYNSLFEKLVGIPLTGVPLVETQQDMDKLKIETEKLRKQSLALLEELSSGLEDDEKVVEAEKKAIDDIVLPERLGEQIKTKKEIAVAVGKKVGRTLGRGVGKALFWWLPEKK